MLQMANVTQLREALQAKLLVEMMGNAVQKELVLKGGLAMRAVHGSVRHTKDIDLDADVAFSKDRIHGLVARSIASVVKSSGLIDNPVVTEPKQTETTLRWKINGTVPGASSPIHLTVEVSRRASLAHDHIINTQLSSDFAPGAAGATVRVLDSQAIAVTKVLALTSPNRLAPRDLYDLAILIQANVPDPSPIFASLPKAQLDAALMELWPKLEALTYAQFEQEVGPYLPKGVMDTIDQETYAEMQLTVGERVEKWLQDALARQASSPSLGTGALGVVKPITTASAEPARKHSRSAP